MVFDKVLCPWCGAEMDTKTVSFKKDDGEYVWSAWTTCRNLKCGVEGPYGVYRGAVTEKEAIEAAHAAALRRYTPLLKPMTLEEVLWTEGEIYVEYAGEFDTWACRCFINSTTEEVTVHCIEETETLDFSAYNRTWRCWARRPTDDERSVAGWEK